MEEVNSQRAFPFPNQNMLFGNGDSGDAAAAAMQSQVLASASVGPIPLAMEDPLDPATYQNQTDDDHKSLRAKPFPNGFTNSGSMGTPYHFTMQNQDSVSPHQQALLVTSPQQGNFTHGKKDENPRVKGRRSREAHNEAERRRRGRFRERIKILSELIPDSIKMGDDQTSTLETTIRYLRSLGGLIKWEESGKTKPVKVWGMQHYLVPPGMDIEPPVIEVASREFISPLSLPMSTPFPPPQNQDQ